MASSQFTEQQSIPSIWRILIFGGTTLMIVFIAIMIYLTEWESMPADEKPYLLLMLLGPLSTAILFVLRLDVRITQQSVEYKVYPFRKGYKVIPMSKITSIELIRPKGLKSMKSVGAHRNINQTELNFGGKYLISLTMDKGRILTFTTNKPQELSSFLSALPEGGPKITIAIDKRM